MFQAASQAFTMNGLFPMDMLAVSIKAEPLIGKYGWLTNSIFVAIIVVLLMLWATKKATRKLSPVPSGFQNFFELAIEFLYNQVEGIVGKKVAPRAFPLLATIFLFVTVANWFGLLPGVGTMGFGQTTAPLTLDMSPDENGHVQHFTPLLRPATADLNMTLGIAFVFMLVWGWLTFKEVGIIGFLKHVFAPKGGLKGLMGTALIPIFLFVGVIELISIAFRPVSLSLRLFGNVFAGETLLHTMSTMLDKLHPVLSFMGSVLLPLPFFFLEILVGVLQATVFSLLCAVYIQISTAHDEEH